jgi:hypothetical protein
MSVTTFTNSVQVSGVRFQQPNSTRCAGVAHKMDFFTGVALNFNQFRVQRSRWPEKRPV